MKIGLIDLDTSHPANWVPILRDMGHEITGVCDAGAVHPAGYAERFAAEHGIPEVYSSASELAENVDCAIVHSCNWDTHIESARPLVEAGKAVLIDKPLAGNVRDLRQLAAWAARGARIGGGSSLRFCAEVREWFERPLEHRGTPHTVICGCGVDEFNYGIHAYSLLLGIMGGGVCAVRHLGKDRQRSIQVRWSDGRTGMLVIGESAAWLPFHATIVTEKSVTHLQPDPSRLYAALLGAVMPALAGNSDAVELTPDERIAPELCALAAKQSWENDDIEVRLEEVAPETAYHGAEFAQSYRKQRYPQ